MMNIYYEKALQFIQENDISKLPNGKHVIDEGNVWVNIVETNLRPASEALLEVHDVFLDIHIPFTGSESYGVKPRIECQLPKGEIDQADDILFFDDKIEQVITKRAGEQTVFLPDMAHAPLIGDGPIRKAIFKVRLG